MFEENDRGLGSVVVEADDAGLVVAFTDSVGSSARHSAAFGSWRQGRSPLFGEEPEPVAGSAGWTDENTLALPFYACETPFARRYVFRLDDDALQLQMKPNVGFGPVEWTTLVARAER